MIAHFNTKQDSLPYSGYIRDKESQQSPDSPADTAEQQEEFVVGVLVSQSAITAEAESMNEYVSPDGAGEDVEEDPQERGYDVNIASVYLREMNTVPLLTRKREIEVAKRIQQTEQKIRSLIRRCPIQKEEILLLRRKSKRQRIETRSSEDIVPEVIRKLVRMAQSERKDSRELLDLVQKLKKTETDLKSAKAEMIQSNLRLVVSIAKIYLNRGLPFLDLIQEGNMGLMKAVTRYDYRKGFKFSTYASWWIRQAITRALADKSRTIRIPNHLLETRSKIVKAFHELIKDLNRDPLPEEIADSARIPLASVRKVMSLIQEPVSLETPVGEDGSKLQDLVESEDSQNFNDDLIENMDLAKRTHDLLSLLNPREEQILRLRFGIGMPSGYTLEEIGKRFGISRERVRQIEERALKKLKHPIRSEPSEGDGEHAHNILGQSVHQHPPDL
jgi:RNA polymerase primary sigma factor